MKNVELDIHQLMGVRLNADRDVAGKARAADAGSPAEPAMLGMKEGFNPQKKGG